MRLVTASGFLLATIILMDILGGIEVDIFVPSFPQLQSYFNISPFWLEALLSANFIGFCLSLLVVGALADKYSRKSVILSGLIIFIFGSILCIIASNYYFLLIGRFIQGIGIAAPANLCFLIIADMYDFKKQQYWMGILNGFMNTAVAAAPFAGSYLTMYFSWQSNFVVLLILAILTLAMTILFIPNYKLPIKEEKINLSAYFPIISKKPLLLLIINTNMMSTPYWVFLGMSSLLYMEALGVSLTEYGYYQGGWALVYGIGSIILGPVINKFKSRDMLNVANLLFIISLVIIIYLSWIDCKNPIFIALAFIPFSIGSILPSLITYPLALNFIKESKGKISSTIQAFRLIQTSICLEIAGYLYNDSFQNLGIIITIMIVIAIVTTFMIINNKEIMKEL